MSDNNTQIAFWIVGAASAAAVVATLSLGARHGAPAAQAVSSAHAVGGAGAVGAAPAASAAELGHGLSLLPLVQGAAAADAAQALATVPEAADVTQPATNPGTPLAQVAFESGQTALSPKAKALLLDIAVGIKKMEGATLVISGFHDATGSAEVNARLAKERAQAVRDELVAKGLPADRITLQKPQLMLGNADPALARRVDIGLIR